MSDHRAKTTPGSTAGSFAPSGGRHSRVEPAELLSACGQPVTTSASHVSTCQKCWYEGKQLAANFATQIARLTEATGREWAGEHTGGGCFWLVTYQGDSWVAITTTDGPFEGDDTPEGAGRHGAGYMIGAFANPDDDGEYTDCAWSDDALAVSVAAACNRLFNTTGDDDDDDDGERRCVECGDSFNMAEAGTDFDGDAGGSLCHRCG